MKRILIITAVIAAALLVSCKKQANPDLPSITWQSNEKFAQMELTPAANGAISLSAPGGIQSLTLTLGLGDFVIVANPYISISSNKGTAGKAAIFDVIDDSSVVSFLQDLGMPAGSSLRGNTLTTLDLIKILDKLTTGQPIANNTTFTMDISLVDKEGNSTAKSAKFHFTSEPSYTWDGNNGFEIIDLEAAKVPAKVKVSAPGKIAKLTIKLESGAAKEVADYIQQRTDHSTTIIDLSGDDKKAADAFSASFPFGNKVIGKTDAVLDFEFMYTQRFGFSAGTSVFTITTEDQNGKVSSTQARFKK